MQNKRGISQVFSSQARGVHVRCADLADVFDISRVLVASISRLCVADHGNDPEKLRDWTSNKTAGDIRGWIVGGCAMWVAEIDGRIAGVGALGDAGLVQLLYVAPEAKGYGVGKALLAVLEQALVDQGLEVATLMATKTALAFYRAQGWEPTGEPAPCYAVQGQPMRKLLQIPA